MSSITHTEEARIRFGCPTCHMVAGEMCRRVSGNLSSSNRPMKAVHRSRLRLLERFRVDLVTIGQAVAERDGWQCFRCARNVFTGPSNCHHRMLAGAGGPDTAENRITLCGSGTQLCHGWVHNNVQESMDNGWLISRHRAITDIPGIRVMRSGFGWVHLTADYQIHSEDWWRQHHAG